MSRSDKDCPEATSLRGARRTHLERHAPSKLRLSAITLAELRFGIAKSEQPRRALFNLLWLLGRVSAVPFDDAATERYDVLRALRERAPGTFGNPANGHGPLTAIYGFTGG